MTSLQFVSVAKITLRVSDVPVYFLGSQTKLIYANEDDLIRSGAAGPSEFNSIKV